MAVPYNHKAIEAKWRKIWDEKPVNGSHIPQETDFT